ncbi:MAG: chemotaxis-specific protein-glutamate methyltransferase CheB [Deltaproteobacteria bacterium]|nr:chemotaxis-specific protein-glutamate methyltransferase CheB [Deltaproteobacteria bacterium]
MPGREDELRKRLLATFKVEAAEHLQAISSGLVDLEGEPARESRAKLLEKVFREAHSLKGAARAVNLGQIESLCQAMESVLGALKAGAVKPSLGVVDLFQEAVDLLTRIVPELEAERPPDERARLTELTTCFDRASRGEPEPERAPVPLPPSEPAGPGLPSSETVRVDAARLTSVLRQTEEMLSLKVSARQRALDLRAANGEFAAWNVGWGKILPVLRDLRAEARRNPGPPAGGMRPRPLGSILEFLEWNRGFVKALETRYAAEAKALDRDSRALGGMVDGLLGEVKTVLMFPFSHLLELVPKIVRDLTRESGKDVGLVVQGGEIEIDRRILDELKDPLVHLLRNAVDHGVERPEERRAKNKPARGEISITVSPTDDKIELVVTDDGRGVPLPELRAAIARLGILPRGSTEALAEQELLPYAFHSGISTSPIVTDLSGRGLGLAIVREKVESLGGTVSLESEAGQGTRFRLLLPLTVATLRGILVRVGEHVLVLPTMHAERVLRLRREEIQTVENREAIELNRRAVSLVRLGDLLSIPSDAPQPGSPELLKAVLLGTGGTRIAFLVDGVLGEQEVLLKRLGSQLSRVRNVAGVTVLGSGRVVPILNVPDLLKSAVKVSSPAFRPGAAAPAPGAEGPKRSILVAEDSITTRALLKNILETAGYRVETAVDGVDALTKVKSGEFDIVVSDVDMPRMNGFDLTARIRADKALEELPVVLVTALASAADRERGIDVGANAYIVKSSFDQSNLLEVIRRLASEAVVVRVLVVEDSPVGREVLAQVLESDAELRVVGTAGDGREAIAAIRRERPDVVTMDLDMPKMDGYEATRAIMQTNPVPIVAVSASIDPEAVASSFRALEAGAVAAVALPRGAGHPDHERSARELVRYAKAMSGLRLVRRWPAPEPRIDAPLEAAGVREPQEVQLVAIGASAGGPPAVRQILASLPADFGAPVLIVQHMAEGFVKGFAEWLATSSGVALEVARDGEAPRPGFAYVAPYGYHLGVARNGRMALRRGQLGDTTCPSVSHLFRSVLEAYGARAVGVLLTGMGTDGAEELRLMRQRGAVTIAQDEASSLIFGMPGEAARLHAAAYVLPPDRIAELLKRLVRRREAGPEAST